MWDGYMHLKLERELLSDSIILAATNKIKKLYVTNREVYSGSLIIIQKKVCSIFEYLFLKCILKHITNNKCHRQHIYQIGGGNH